VSDAPDRIRYWDYLGDYRAHRDEYLRTCDEVLGSGRLLLGPRLEAFEARLAAACGVPHAVGLASGTDALHLTLRALGIGEGDQVVTVANTAVPTVAAIRAAGATPVFVDVEEETFLMDVARLEATVGPRTRCILPVHLFGQMVDMAPLLACAQRHGLAVVEDCAQACGATYRGRPAGCLGDAGAFSFYPTKVLGAFGDAGAVTTSRPDLRERLRDLRTYGMQGGAVARVEGINSRLDELQAALLTVRMGRLDAAVARRRRIAELYDTGLGGVGDVRLPTIAAGRTHQYYLYTIRTAQRDALQRHLGDQGIGTKVNYPVPIHRMPAYRHLDVRPGALPVTERLAGTLLSLPIYPELTDAQVAEVVGAVRAFFARGVPRP